MSEFRLRSAYPVSPNCPGCSATEFKRVKAQTSIAFTDDRICKECGTRYTPPTPLWARGVFAVLGLGALIGSLAGAVWMISGDDPREKGFIYFLIVGGFLGVGCLYMAFASK